MKILKNRFSFLLLICFIACNQGLKEVQSTPEKVVLNGQFPIHLPIPKSINHQNHFKVTDTKTKVSYPAQRWDEQALVFLVENNNSQNIDQYQVEAATSPYFEDAIHIHLNKEGTKLLVNIKEKPVLTYQISEELPEGKAAHYRRSGFIHPLFSPNGKILTDDFPEGHTHQHGIFFAFVKCTYKGEKLDFWNQHQGTGTIEHSRLGAFQGGPVFGRFESEQTHLSLKYGAILKENWVVTIYNSDPYRIDIQTTLQSVTKDTLFINDYHYGGMAFRGTKVWNETDSLHFQNEPNFITSEEISDLEAANHSRPAWSSMFGLIDGESAGVAILGHPSNFRYPEPIRVHPTMPYYCISPMVGQAFTIAPNANFKATYTYFSFNGTPPLNSFRQVLKEF